MYQSSALRLTSLFMRDLKSAKVFCVSVKTKPKGTPVFALIPILGFSEENKSESVMNKPNLHSQNNNKKKTNKKSNKKIAEGLFISQKIYT